MSELNQDDLDHFQRQLKQRRDELRHTVAEKLRQTEREDFSALVGRVRDAGEESVAELVASTNLTLLDRETRELREVEAALNRMREGQYGICIECGADIGRERLQVRLTASRCIHCQTRREQSVRGGRDATPSL